MSQRPSFPYNLRSKQKSSPDLISLVSKMSSDSNSQLSSSPETPPYPHVPPVLPSSSQSAVPPTPLIPLAPPLGPSTSTSVVPPTPPLISENAFLALAQAMQALSTQMSLLQKQNPAPSVQATPVQKSFFDVGTTSTAAVSHFPSVLPVVPSDVSTPSVVQKPVLSEETVLVSEDFKASAPNPTPILPSPSSPIIISPPRARPTRPTMSLPAPFCGKIGENIREWLARYEIVASYSGWSSEMKKDCLAAQLEGPAMYWWMDWQERNSHATWTIVKDALVRRFSSEDETETYRQALEHLRYDGSLTLEAFLTTVSHHLRKSEPFHQPMRLVDVFLRKLPYETQRDFNASDPRNEEDLLAACKRVARLYHQDTSNVVGQMNNSRNFGRPAPSNNMMMRNQVISRVPTRISAVDAPGRTFPERPFSGTCYYCKKIGHRIADCLKRKRDTDGNEDPQQKPTSRYSERGMSVESAPSPLNQ